MFNQLLSKISARKTELKVTQIKKKVNELSTMSVTQLKDLFQSTHSSDICTLIAICTLLSEKILKQRPFDSQLLGIVNVVEGNALDMQTGEGKTLVCTLSSAVLSKQLDIVRVVTANKYLSERDYKFSKPIFEALEISSSDTPCSQSHIQYSIMKDIVMSWIQDHSRRSIEEMTHHGFNTNWKSYGIIIDEIDTSLIESSTSSFTLIDHTITDHDSIKVAYHVAKKILAANPEVAKFENQELILCDSHFDLFSEFLAKSNPAVDLSDTHSDYYYMIRASLLALTLKKERDYLVINNSILGINKETGRTRNFAFSALTLNALEIKERIRLSQRSVYSGTSTLQNYVNKYDFVSGMSGTASINKLELKHTYGVNTVNIPARLNSQLVNHGYKVFNSHSEKLTFALELIQKNNDSGNPILVICQDEDEVCKLSQQLTIDNRTHNRLTAKNIQDEEIVCYKAGLQSSITITTRIVARGTDIIPKFGHLFVLSTGVGKTSVEDLQISGRTARQGAKGECIFLCSKEDDFFSQIRSRSPIALDNIATNPNSEAEIEAQAKALKILISRIQKSNLAQKRNVRKQLMYFDRPIAMHFDTLMEKRLSILRNKQAAAPLLKANEERQLGISFLDLLSITNEAYLSALDDAWSKHINTMVEHREDLVRFGANGIPKYKSKAIELLEGFIHDYRMHKKDSVQRVLDQLV